MPRTPRINIPGYYHVLNRGLNRENIFLENEDKEKFIELVDLSRKAYQLTIHSFCVLDNHYHLLMETSRNNLSLAVRSINSRYAAWFNKKMHRSGPLWQGRFKSRYIHDDDYFWLLLRYIEMNPVKAGIVERIGDYPYSASYSIVNKRFPDVLTGSCLYQKELSGWILPLEEEELQSLSHFESIRIQQRAGTIKPVKRTLLGDYFSGTSSREQRNFNIHRAFYAGYKQSEIARYLQISTVAVSRLIDRENKRHILFRKIRDKGLFWSYSSDIVYGPEKINLLIETVLKYADLDDIRTVFELFGKRAVAAVWVKQMKADARFKKLNYFLARIFFDMDVEADEFNQAKQTRAEKLRLLAG